MGEHPPHGLSEPIGPLQLPCHGPTGTQFWCTPNQLLGFCPLWACHCSGWCQVSRACLFWSLLIDLNTLHHKPPSYPRSPSLAWFHFSFPWGSSWHSCCHLEGCSLCWLWVHVDPHPFWWHVLNFYFLLMHLVSNKKYFTFMCFVFLLLAILPFTSSKIALLLSWYNDQGMTHVVPLFL